MRKSVALAFVLMTSLVGQAFAETHVPLPKRVCTSKVMCIINGKAYDPSTPIGYSCNNGHAAPVTTCHTASVPQK
jgi:hypothetical protein